VSVVKLKLWWWLTDRDQAQPNKLRLKGQKDGLMEEKMLAKAHVIASAANRLWSKYCSWKRSESMLTACRCTDAG
jgi:hypothetical protein